MAVVRLETAGAVFAGDIERVQGITDLHVVQGPEGPLLLSVGRGGDFMVAFRITSGGVELRDQLELNDNLLQLEHTDIAVLGDSVILAGLADNQLQLMPIGSGNQTLTSLTERTLPGLDARTISQIDTLGDQALVGLQGGGLRVLDLDATPSVRAVSGMPGGAVGGVAMVEAGGQTYGFATFWQENTLVALRISPFGSATLLDSLSTDVVGGALSTPMTVRAAEVGGEVFAITVAAGTGTLSAFRLGEEGLLLTDAIIDSRDTRFAQAQHLETLEVDGRLYIAAAGSDMGISLFTLLPGGRLHHLDSIAASIDTPLRGITDITMAEVNGQIMLWAATEAAPHLVEFRATGTFGLTIREALARGIPVIQSDSGGTTEHGAAEPSALIPIGAGPAPLRAALEAALDAGVEQKAAPPIASFEDQAAAFMRLTRPLLAPAPKAQTDRHGSWGSAA